MTDAAQERLAQIRSQTVAVIPAYHDEKHIGDIVRRTAQQLDHVLVIDDGSNDETAQRAREAGAEVIVHSQNRGKGEAIKTGLRHCLAREVTWLILLMPFIRRVVNRYMSRRISHLCGQRIPDTQCGFRMLHQQLIPELLGGGDRFDYDTEVLIIASRKRYRIEPVPITTVYSDQVSNIHPVRDAFRFFKLMRRYKASRT